MLLHSIWGSCVCSDTPAAYWSWARQHETGHQQNKRTQWEQPSKHGRADAKRKYIWEFSSWVMIWLIAVAFDRIKSSLSSCRVFNTSESLTQGSTSRQDKWYVSRHISCRNLVKIRVDSFKNYFTLKRAHQLIWWLCLTRKIKKKNFRSTWATLSSVRLLLLFIEPFSGYLLLDMDSILKIF